MTEAPLSAHFLSSSIDRPPLRIGVLLDGPSTSRAAASVIRDLQASNFARIELVVFNARRADAASPRPGDSESPTAFQRFRAEGGIAFATYALLDRRRAGTADDPLDLVDVRELLGDVPSVTIEPMAAGRMDVLPADAMEDIRAKQLDVIVQLGLGRVDGAILSAARDGVWAFHHGDDVRYRGGPACFWEIVEGSPVCGVVLRRLTPDSGGGIVLDGAWFATDAGSLARTRVMAFYGSTHLLIRNLRLLHERGWSGFEARRTADPVVPPSRSIDRSPSVWDVVRWFVPLAVRKMTARLIRVVTRADDVLHWRVAIRVGHAGLGPDGPADMTGFRWIESPPGHYYADPFVVERDGRRWLFFEDYSYARGAAVIACAEIGAGGDLVAVREVLGSVGHLSYPMVVLDGGEALMFPESAAEGVVRAHRATAFPDHWAIAAELLPAAAVDTTVWSQDGRWWFFTTVAEPRGKSAVLMLFHADAFDGPWVPHPLNPISQDVRTNRGGGSLFTDGGRLIRPSQDSSRGYGYSVTLNEITVLSETDYAERPRATITPDWEPGLLGMHTYNHVGDVEVIDGKVSRPRSSVG